MGIRKGKKIDGTLSKRNQNRQFKRKAKGKLISMNQTKGFKKDPNTVEKMSCVMTLSEKDCNEALKQQFIRINGVLYDVPVFQLQELIKNKKFGMVKMSLTKAKSQTPPSAPGTINVMAEDRKDLIKWIKKHKPSNAEPGSPFLKLEREDCGCEFVFQLQKDIPKESFTCEHGNKIIEYTK